MYEFLYYLTLPFVIASASLASYYILYPNESKKQFMNLTWNVTKFMVECNDIIGSVDKKVKTLKNDMFDKNTGYDSDSESGSDSNDDEYSEVIVYNNVSKYSFTCTPDNIGEKTDILNNENINLVLYHCIDGDNEQYKRIDTKKDLDILKDDETDISIKNIEKQFIQVEYITEDNNGNEKIVDIHSNLGDFYVKGNIILDKYFLEWYLETFYDIELDNDYKLRFFDKDVNMFTLSTNNAIILSDNTYSKIDIDDNTFLINDDEYEGAVEDDDAE